MENIWHHRRVAETAAKSCMVCYKPSSSVLITPDTKDFFYICPSHLKDRNFALPTDDEAKAMAERKKKEELDREIEAVKKEYEEKMKKKQQKKDKTKDKDKDKDAKDKDDTKTDAAEKERDDKIKALTDKAGALSSQAQPTVDDGPRVFRLQKHVSSPQLGPSTLLLTLGQTLLQHAPGKDAQRRDCKAQSRPSAEPPTLSLSAQGSAMKKPCNRHCLRSNPVYAPPT